MYERMLNKKIIPTEDEIKKYIGKDSVAHIEQIRKALEGVFEITMELKFPFGNKYGWGYKVSGNSKHLFYLFFEKGAVTVMLQISKIRTEREIENYNRLSEEGKKYWETRYPCGDNGGWVHYRITKQKQLKDIGIFLSIRTNKEIDFA